MSLLPPPHSPTVTSVWLEEAAQPRPPTGCDAARVSPGAGADAPELLASALRILLLFLRSPTICSPWRGAHSESTYTCDSRRLSSDRSREHTVST